MGGTILALAAYLAYEWSNGADLGTLAAIGYPGVFLVMLVSGTSTFLPMPALASVLAAGAVWNPLLVGIAAGAGNATGETIACLVCRAAASVVHSLDRSRWIGILRGWFQRHGFLTILAIALIPNPIFDMVGILAAVTGYPLRRFWLACVIGNCAKYTAMAHFGQSAGSLLAMLG